MLYIYMYICHHPGGEAAPVATWPALGSSQAAGFQERHDRGPGTAMSWPAELATLPQGLEGPLGNG